MVRLLWAAWAVGLVAVVAVARWLWRVDDSCPQWEDEGTSAAPPSPYALYV